MAKKPADPQEEDKTQKKERKDYTSLKAWQRGHELNLALAEICSEYEAELTSKPWCKKLKQTLENACVYLMEAYRRFPVPIKQNYYEQALFSISQAQYISLLGQELGIWDLQDFIIKLQDYYSLTTATLINFLDSQNKKNQSAKNLQA